MRRSFVEAMKVGDRYSYNAYIVLVARLGARQSENAKKI